MGRSREGRQGGGVGFLVRDGVAFCARSDLSCAGAEDSWIEIFLTSGSILVCSVYIPPDDLESLQYFATSVEQISTRYSRFMLCGDFNSHSFAFGCDTEDAMGARLRELKNDLHLSVQNHPGEHTRFGYDSQADSVLDLTLTSKTASECFLSWETVDTHVCKTDHVPILLCISPQPLPACIEGDTRRVWNFSACDWSAYGKRVSEELNDWMSRKCSLFPDGVLTNDEFDEVWREWVVLVLRVAEQVIGFRNVRKGKKRGVVWWNSELTRLKRVKNRAYRRWKKRRTDANRASFRAALKEFECAKTAARLAHWQELCASLETCDESVRWKRLKTLRPSSSPASLPPLLGEDDDLILDEDEKVAALNLFFSRVATTFDSSKFRADHFEGVVQALSRNAAAFLPDTASDVSENGSICEKEVRKCVRSLKLSKASGPDAVPAELIRYGGPGMCRSLTWMFNLSWDMGYLPVDWRTAHITPVP